MRQIIVALAGVVFLLSACASEPGTQSGYQNLREAQSQLALAEARSRCVMATNLPPENKIVQTCINAMAADIYPEIVARDAAQMERFQ